MFRIQIDGVQPGAISRSMTTDEGLYQGVLDGIVRAAKLTPATDFDTPPAALGIPDSPIGIRTGGGTVTLFARVRNTFAAEGSFQTLRARGRASLLYNVGVIFRVVQDPGDTPQSTVTLGVTGMMDGFTLAKPNALVPGDAEASLDARVEIIGGPKATALSTSSGTSTSTHGITLSTDPSIGPQASKQVTNAGNRPELFSWLPSVPVNSPLVCQLSLALTARASAIDVPILGRLLRETAHAVLAVQYVSLIPDPPGRALTSSATATVSLDLGGGLVLSLAHPLASLGVVETAQGQADGEVFESGVTLDYSGFQPEVETVRVNGEVISGDPLKGALIAYPSMSVIGVEPDGSVLLSGGTLTFSDAESGAVIATAEMNDVRVGLIEQTLTARLDAFTAEFDLETSLVGSQLSEFGGTLLYASDVLAALGDGLGLELEVAGMPAEVLITPNV